MKRLSGSGSIREYTTRAGVRYRAALPALSTGGRQTWKTFATREEAERALAAACSAIAAGELVYAGQMTLGRYGERWLASCQHRSAPDDRSRWRRHIAKRPIAELPIDQIKPGHIKRHIESLMRARKLVPTPGGVRRFSDETISPQTVKHVYNLLRRCFREAITDGHLSANPCAGYRLPRDIHSRPAEPMPFLTADEIAAVLDPQGPVLLRYRIIYEVAIFSGLREGELWGLRWEDVDLAAKHPSCLVRRSYGGPTKNRKSHRVYLLPRAAAALRRWRELQDHPEPASLVFPGPGGRMHAHGYDAEWGGRGKNREKLGIRRAIRFHDFRHSCVSHLLMGTWGPKWSIYDVSKWIGHSSISVTQRYAHLSPSHLADLAAQMTPPAEPDASAPGLPTSANQGMVKA